MTVPKNEQLDEVQLIRNSFLAYCVAQYSTFSAPRHIMLIIKHLEAVARGEIKRLMIFAPPRHGKSETISKLFPAWYIGKHLGKKTVAIATYGQDLSNEIGMALQGRMNSDLYKEVFPESVPSKNSNSMKRLITVSGGGYMTVGVGGALTGKGGHLRILDDPNKNREEADSDIEQNKQWDWWTSVFMTRGEQDIVEDAAQRSNEDDSPIIVVLTRWSDKDIAKKLMDKEKEDREQGIPSDRWVILNLEAVCESEGDPLGRTPVPDPNDPKTWTDESALWPQKYNARKLAALRYAVGTRDWNALYQQRPSSASGDVYLRSTWQFYQVLPADCNKPVCSWDMNYGDSKQKGDFAVGLVGAKRKSSVYLIDRRKGRYSLEEAVNHTIQLKAIYPDITAIWIERKANGLPVIQTVKSTVPGVVGVDPETLGSKDSRNEAAGKYQNAGNIYLPLNEPWVDDFIEALASYPNGKYDDDADAFAQMVIMLLGQPDMDGLIKFYEAQLRRDLPNVVIDLQKLPDNHPYHAVYGIKK